MIPNIFIGSSVRGLSIAEAIKVNLHYDARCEVWTQAFPLSHNTIDTLLQKCSENAFAIFVFSNDDILNLKEKTLIVARDNVLFESGLFMGMHGKERCN